MNVFVLSTGRCGSTTFVRACDHISNFSAGHETRARLLGRERLNYPSHHIESDHYLSWFLGKLDSTYGDAAHYVHLSRDPIATAHSWMFESPHWIGSLARAYQYGILKMAPVSLMDANVDRIETVTANIRHFLKDKSHVMTFSIETASDDWPRFWEWIGAEGDYGASLSEWSIPHNAEPKGLHVPIRNMRHKAQHIFRVMVPR